MQGWWQYICYAFGHEQIHSYFFPHEKIKPFFSETLSKESSYKMCLSFAAATASDLGFYEEMVPQHVQFWRERTRDQGYWLDQTLLYEALWNGKGTGARSHLQSTGKNFHKYLTDCNKIHRRVPAQWWCLLGKKMLKVLHRSLQGNQQCSWKEANSFKENILTPMLLCEIWWVKYDRISFLSHIYLLSAH